MLILPLHRTWTRANFPWMAMLLVLANVFVFAFLQSGDHAVYQQAQAYYEQADLGAIEFPAYAQWLTAHGRGEAPTQPFTTLPPGAMLALIESDGAFLADLHADRVILPTDPRHAQWQNQRAQFDAILDRAFSRAHALRFSHVEPGRIVTSMFMHGGLDHLLGNMLFLLAVGMLVEGALGHGWFLGLYLCGGICAALASLYWHWGSEGNSLGASGAIAALMGAYCVIWGRRKVRVFYWFFVVFDYVKVPALAMLGLWFAWLVVVPSLDAHSHIDYADHAGGLLAGIGMAFALRARGWVRRDFIDEDERIERTQHDDAELERAQRLIGQMEIPKARDILLRLDRDQPGRLPVRIALYRCARYQGTPAQVDAAAAGVLEIPAPTDAIARELQSVWEDYAQACAGAPRLPTDTLQRLLPVLQRLDADAAVDGLLRALIERDSSDATLAQAWFALCLRTPDGTPARRARLAFLLERYPQSDYAPKARFLLGQG
ncbi:MAG: rhomboid family intramembrane serine protease [Proteobacteria bacterium]|nr:rhomboid family intramembrane serine protease [Pseudomonadota bacterium]